MRTEHRRHRRAVAMLLVLISMAMATILTVAYLASRDNSAAIGENVASSSSARWTAVSGLDIGVAVLQTKTNWRTDHIAGKLVDDYTIDGVTLDIDITDIETGKPPTDKSRYIQLVSTALAAGIEQTATAVADVPLPEDDNVAAVDLSEFAIFATDKIVLQNDAVVTRWPQAPLTALGKPVSLGTQASGASSIELQNNAAAVDAIVYTPPDASNTLVFNATGPEVGTTKLEDTIPVPTEPDPGVEWPKVTDSYINVYRSGTYVAVNDAVVRTGSITFEHGAVSHWIGDVTVIANHNVSINSDSAIIVEGDATLICFEDLDINRGSIQVLDDSTLTIYVLDDLILNNGYIGDGPYDYDTDRDNSGDADWIDPSKIQIYGIETAERDSNWDLNHTSVIKASIYAPSVPTFTVRDTSALYGRILAQEITAKNHSAIFYDHSLDSGNGYTNPLSELFDGDGNIKDAFKAITTLSGADVNAAAAAADIGIKVGDIEYNWPEVVVPVPTPAGQSTPRPVMITYEFESFGADIEKWELAAAENQ